MTAGTLSHARIQNAMLNAGMVKVYRDENNEATTEFKITNQDPPIFGYGDVMFDWQGQELIGEIKTMMNQRFASKRITGES